MKKLTTLFLLVILVVGLGLALAGKVQARPTTGMVCDEDGDLRLSQTDHMSTTDPENITTSPGNSCDTTGDECGECMDELIESGCQYGSMNGPFDQGLSNENPTYAIVMLCPSD